MSVLCRYMRLNACPGVQSEHFYKVCNNDLANDRLFQELEEISNSCDTSMNPRNSTSFDANIKENCLELSIISSNEASISANGVNYSSSVLQKYEDSYIGGLNVDCSTGNRNVELNSTMTTEDENFRDFASDSEASTDSRLRWNAVFCYPPVLACYYANFTGTYGFTTFGVNQPLFMRDLYGFKISQVCSNIHNVLYINKIY